jgi:phosphohistidine phosphatase
MRSLILFRHGKSDWNADFASDHERPLANRGKEAALCMGRMLSESGQLPQLAVTSSALRARATLQLAVRAGRWHCPIRVEDALYGSTPDRIMNWIKALEDNPECLLLTGHEPTWSELAGRLIGEGSVRVPTASMLKIDFEIQAWRQIHYGRGQLKWLMPPKLVCSSKGAK